MGVSWREIIQNSHFYAVASQSRHYHDNNTWSLSIFSKVTGSTVKALRETRIIPYRYRYRSLRGADCPAMIQSRNNDMIHGVLIQYSKDLNETEHFPVGLTIVLQEYVL